MLSISFVLSSYCFCLKKKISKKLSQKKLYKYYFSFINVMSSLVFFLELKRTSFDMCMPESNEKCIAGQRIP